MKEYVHKQNFLFDVSAGSHNHKQKILFVVGALLRVTLIRGWP